MIRRRLTRAQFAARCGRAIDRVLTGAWIGLMILLVLGARQVALSGDAWLGISMATAAITVLFIPILASREGRR